MNKYEVLKYYFGYNAFRSGQEEIIDSIVNNINVLCILPTGGGKSICFQVPGLLMDGLTIVISPLISLMSDQVRVLREKRINARFINSSMSYPEQKTVLDEINENCLKFLYVSPERFNNKEFLSVIKNSKVCQIVLDEAHSISIYGHDFRKEYSEIYKCFSTFKKVPVISAFTATASQSVINDIRISTKIDFKVFKFGFDRKNLYYETYKSGDKIRDIKKIIDSHKGECMIIYTLTRRKCEEYYNKFKSLGYNVSIYHGGLDTDIKKHNELEFMRDKTNIMFATSAFGTGIDKPNIRVVVNVGFPMSIEDLSQQQGRAGRDGEKSVCILLYSLSDRYENEYFIQALDEAELSIDEIKTLKKVKRKKLNEVIGYATTNKCLHEYMCASFGELIKSRCNNCSNCLKEYKEIDVLDDARLILNTIKLTNESFGTNMISKIVTGSKDKEIKEKLLNRLKTYNKSFKSVNEVKEIISNMLNDGYLERTNGEFPLLKLNENSEILYNSDKYKIKI